MHETGILEFNVHPRDLLPQQKMELLFSSQYTSNYNVFILPFYSLATPSSGKWSGVAGIKRLFKNGFNKLDILENLRIKSLLDKFSNNNDTVLIFQKDVFLSLSQYILNPIKYDYTSLLKSPLEGDLLINHDISINLINLLPTRLLYSKCTRNILQHLAKKSYL